LIKALGTSQPIKSAELPGLSTSSALEQNGTINQYMLILAATGKSSSKTTLHTC
jgi:hypothetical protein